MAVYDRPRSWGEMLPAVIDHRYSEQGKFDPYVIRFDLVDRSWMWQGKTRTEEGEILAAKGANDANGP